MVVSEAASVGTRSVAYDVAGLQDSVRLADGRLCEPNPTALAATVDEVLDSWMLAPANAQISSGTGDWEHVAASFLAQVSEMCSLGPVQVG